MASSYKQVLLYKVVKAWDDNDLNLSECYKLQSNISPNKSRVNINTDNGIYGIKFTIDKMIPEFNKEAELCNLTWSDSSVQFKNVLQGQQKTTWKQVLHEHFLEPVNDTILVPVAQDHNVEESFHQAPQLFIQQILNKKSLGTGSIFICSLEETTSSKSP
jgi:hypothetical protein